MRQITDILNTSMEIIPPDCMLVLASSYEDRNADEMRQAQNTWSFILDAIAPDKFVMVFTGAYITDPKNYKRELYDNYNNRVILIHASVWDHFKKDIAKHERAVRVSYGNTYKQPKNW